MLPLKILSLCHFSFTHIAHADYWTNILVYETKSFSSTFQFGCTDGTKLGREGKKEERKRNYVLSHKILHTVKYF